MMIRKMLRADPADGPTTTPQPQKLEPKRRPHVRALTRTMAAVAATCSWTVVAAAAADEPKDVNPLQTLERFVGGAWVTQGEGGDTHVRTRVVYEWGLNRKLLKVKSYLTPEEGGERLVYESVFFWHPERKKLVFYSISAGGGIFDGTIEPDGDTYVADFRSLSEGKATSYRQSLTFLDADTIRWTVSTKKGDDWVKVIDQTQRRKGG
jgi:hypothetical protein